MWQVAAVLRPQGQVARRGCLPYFFADEQFNWYVEFCSIYHHARPGVGWTDGPDEFVHVQRYCTLSKYMRMKTGAKRK